MCCYHNMLSVLWDIFLALAGGVIASVMYAEIIKSYNNKKLRRLYQHLSSKDSETYDWECFGMKLENGRIPNDQGNGTFVNIRYLSENTLEYRWIEKYKDSTIKEADKRRSGGKIYMEKGNFGNLSFQYFKPGEHEYGFKKLFVIEGFENNEKYDYIFTIGDGKDYFNELLKRKKKERKK